MVYLHSVIQRWIFEGLPLQALDVVHGSYRLFRTNLNVTLVNASTPSNASFDARVYMRACTYVCILSASYVWMYSMSTSFAHAYLCESVHAVVEEKHLLQEKE
jgi:hypothetical protein